MSILATPPSKNLDQVLNERYLKPMPRFITVPGSERTSFLRPNDWQPKPRLIVHLSI
jgi:hypothetical protein